ncbi:MAG: hypothetical protein H0Z32_10530 [Bacillaceae bacterium]|nr:hypothetical protein [Bacillaceae bacterium]
MACIDDKGNLTATAKKILTAVKDQSLTAEDVANEAGLPLFKVRSSLRDMASMGFVFQNGDSYQLNEKAEKLLNRGS